MSVFDLLSRGFAVSVVCASQTRLRITSPYLFLDSLTILMRPRARTRWPVTLANMQFTLHFYSEIVHGREALNRCLLAWAYPSQVLHNISGGMGVNTGNIYQKQFQGGGEISLATLSFQWRF